MLVYKEAGYRLVLDSLRGLALGGIDQLNSTSYFQTDAFVVKADREVPVEVDGEWIGRFSEVSFVQSADHLQVIAPEGPVSGRFVKTMKSLLPWQKGQPQIQIAEKP